MSIKFCLPQRELMPETSDFRFSLDRIKSVSDRSRPAGSSVPGALITFFFSVILYVLMRVLAFACED